MRKIQYTKEQIQAAVASSTSWRQVISKLNPDARYRGSESNIKGKAVKYGIDFAHFPGRGWGKGFKFGPKRPLEDYFNGLEIKSNDLKLRLIKEGIKQCSCEKCHLDIWMGEKIPLELHHVNQNPSDNSLDNLKVLCANCHQLEHRSIQRDIREAKERQSKLLEPQKDINWRKRPREHKRKVLRPSLEEIRQLQQSHTMTAIGKMFGVSCNAVRKWIKIYEREQTPT